MDKYLNKTNNFIKIFIYVSLLTMMANGSSEYGFDSAMTCNSNTKQSRKARTQILAAIPCDLTMQAYCTLPGTSYPWQAVRRFVHENQGLMKRMYGDLRHIAILREEILNNEIDINDIEVASKRYSRDGFHRSSKYMQNIVNKNGDNEYYNNNEQFSNHDNDQQSNQQNDNYKNHHGDRNIQHEIHHILNKEYRNDHHDDNYIQLDEKIKSSQLQSLQTTTEITETKITADRSKITDSISTNIPTVHNLNVVNQEINYKSFTTTTVSTATAQTSKLITGTIDNVTNAAEDIQYKPTTKLQKTFETNTDNLQIFQNKDGLKPPGNNTKIVKLSQHDLRPQTTNANTIVIVKANDNHNSLTQTTATVTAASNLSVTVGGSYKQFISSIPMQNSIKTITTPEALESFTTKLTTIKTETVTERAPSKPHKNLIQLINRQRRPSPNSYNKINSTTSTKLKLKFQTIDPILNNINSAIKTATSASFVPNVENILSTKLISFKFNKNHSRFNSNLHHSHKHSSAESDGDNGTRNSSNTDNTTLNTRPYNVSYLSNGELLYNEKIQQPSLALSTEPTAVSNLTTLTTKVETQLFQDAVKHGPTLAVVNLRGVNACPVKEEVVAPFWANNTRGEVLALLNLYPFEQYVHWEKCTHENKQMYCRDGCRCEQQYRLHRLLAYDPHNECRGIFSDWFRFPSCCICKCYNIPLDLRTTSRSPRSKSGSSVSSRETTDQFDNLEYRHHSLELAEQELKNAIYDHAKKDWYRPSDELSFV